MSDTAACDRCGGEGHIQGPLNLFACPVCLGSGRIDVSPEGQRRFEARKRKAVQVSMFPPEGATK